MSFVNKNIKDYVDKKLTDVTPDLMALRAQGIAAHVPIISDQVSAFLHFQLTLLKPSKILEIGTAIGYSGSIMLTYSNADLTTIELDGARFSTARRNFTKLGFSSRVTMLQGDAASVLEQLTEQKYDLIFIDAAKGHYLDYFHKCQSLLNTNGVIIADNVLLSGYIAGEPHIRRQRTANARMNDFVDYVFSLPNYTTTLLTIGDGVLISTKKR